MYLYTNRSERLYVCVAARRIDGVYVYELIVICDVNGMVVQVDASSRLHVHVCAIACAYECHISLY